MLLHNHIHRNSFLHVSQIHKLKTTYPLTFFFFSAQMAFQQDFFFCSTANTNHKEITLTEYCLLFKSVLKLHSIF